jgi:hypothetical protein
VWPFKRKLAWDQEYAQNIYEGLVEHNDFGDITALKLRIPTSLHQAYQNKMLLQREMLAFVALMENAKDVNLKKVLMTFGDLLVAKVAKRGLQINRDQLADYALNDTERLIASPFPWAQQWLAEFREDPNDNYMVALFADHCLRLHHAYKHGIEETRR